MATNLPKVPVTKTEAGGFLVTCYGPSCRRFHVTSNNRLDADRIADAHLKAHAARLPRFQEDQTW